VGPRDFVTISFKFYTKKYHLKLHNLEYFRWRTADQYVIAEALHNKYNDTFQVYRLVTVAITCNAY
jgi:hypothetical protein